MASIPELMKGHITLEVGCLDRLYLNGYIGKLATGLGLVIFMREQLDKRVPSPVVLGQITERFRAAVKELAEREQIPVHEFRHKEDKDEIANEFRRRRGTRDGIVFIGALVQTSGESGMMDRWRDSYGWRNCSAVAISTGRSWSCASVGTRVTS